MEIFLLFVVLVVLVLMFRKMVAVRDHLSDLRNELHDLKAQFKNTGLTERKIPEPIIPPAVITKPPEIPEIQEVLPIIDVPELQEHEPVPAEQFIPLEPVRVVPQNRVRPSAYVPEAPKPNWFSKWLQDNPDMEKFIGENLINKIGISVLVLGIAFFVKYAIDQEWINKTGRVCIGLLCGVILVWLANRLRKNYHAFSSVLIGGSLVIFYFTIALAFHQYHLISQGAAFAIMVVITVFAVTLSILYDRIELGILATVGGFITPFLVSQGDGNWVVLFSYLTILNAGLIVLAYYKRWRVINFIAFFFTQIIYIGWIMSKSWSPSFNYQGVFIFGLVFYLMSLLMNVIHHVIRGSQLKAFDFIILLSANLCFFGTGIYLIRASGVPQYAGLFTASLGVVNLILAYLFFKKSKADRKFIYLLIGITISFISMAAPVQLKGHYITLFWSAEIVVLLWLYQKSFISLLKKTMLIVTALMVISLMMDWSAFYFDSVSLHHIILNKGFVTGLFSATAVHLVYRLLKKEADTYYVWHITNKLLRNIYLVGSVLILVSAGALEIYDQFIKRMPGTGLEVVYLQLYLTSFVVVVLLLLSATKFKTPAFLPVALCLFVLAAYLLNIYNIYFTERSVLFMKTGEGYFRASWVNVLVLFFLIWKTIKYLRDNALAYKRFLPLLTGIITLTCVVIFSVEIRNLYLWFNYTDELSFSRSESLFDKAGLTIVWSISSFIIIWLGLKYSYKLLRIIALVLFGITLIKLFMIDIRDIAPGGKIIAFILLGALLLIISFMYQRLKKIIIDDTNVVK